MHPRLPGREEPGRVQSIGSHRVRHDSSDLAHMHELLHKSLLDSIIYTLDIGKKCMYMTNVIYSHI